MIIKHKVSPLANFLGNILRPGIWTTKVNQNEIMITRWLGESILIPWEKIECLDLSGLVHKQTASPTFNQFQEKLDTVFFLLMIGDHNFVKQACTWTGSTKTWFAAKNVLGLTGIEKNDGQLLFDKLSQIASDREIKLETICLED